MSASEQKRDLSNNPYEWIEQASERIWMNLPPARVWVYRKG